MAVEDNDKTGSETAAADGAVANENAPDEEHGGLAKRLAAAEAEATEMKDRALRALAEVENIRRRTQREREDAVKYAAANFARDLLSSADNLRRAIASIPEAEVKDETLRTLLAGVAATERELLAAFEKHGIRRIDPKGERFDHNLHQAIFEAENTGKPAGTVVEVLQPGYVMHDRLLRAAMVGVAKGGAASPPPEPGPVPAETEDSGESPRPGERIDTMA